MQTEVTSYVAAHSHADSSYNILKEEHTELLEQVSASSPAAAAPVCGARQEPADSAWLCSSHRWW